MRSRNRATAAVRPMRRVTGTENWSTENSPSTRIRCTPTGGFAASWRLDGPVTEQAIAAARFGLQQTPIGTKRLADRHRMNMQCIFRDDRAWPDAIHQLIFGDDLAGRPGENFDDLESAPADRHGRAKDPEFAAGKVDLALT